MKFQFYPSLGLSFKRIEEEDFDLWINFLIIGPFQWWWYSSKGK